VRHANDSRTKDAARDEAGSTLVEMALCIGLVLMVIFGIMECSLAVYTEHYIESAAVSGARYASVRGSTYRETACTSPSASYCEAGTSDIQNYIRANAAPGITANNISVTASWPGTTGAMGTCDSVQGSDSPGCLVTVTVIYPFTFMLPVPLNQSITFSAVRSTVISQ
jgi:Flp pilus assembly protein TadG